MDQGAGQNRREALTVSQVNQYLKMLLDEDPVLAHITVKGEISNFTNHYRTGHFYLSLKDEGAVLRAVMFKSAAQKLKFLPENGMKVVARGRVTGFPRDGQVQLYIEDLQPDGTGALYIAFEQLKNRLAAEGLFDAAYKKPLPKVPYRIGIITSPTGAAVRDMIHVAGRRFPLCELWLYPSLVQGDGAPEQLIRGVEYFNKTKSVDVILLGRGGGSLEELWAFNDEGLARAIYASEIPVVSAVGHETDFSISDFVADLRAPTPSAAAEVAVPDKDELRRKIGNVAGHMRLSLQHRIAQGRTALGGLASKRVLTNPLAPIDDRRLLVDYEARRLQAAAARKVDHEARAFAGLAAKMEALNPLSVLARGFAAAYDRGGTLLRSAAQAAPGDEIAVRLSDGTLRCTVNEAARDEDGSLADEQEG